MKITKLQLAVDRKRGGQCVSPNALVCCVSTMLGKHVKIVPKMVMFDVFSW